MTRDAGRFVLKKLYVAAVLTWSTKSFDFWTLLMLVLSLARPHAIIELGSGRSTSYLAEYAMKRKARYLSIEQNRFYAKKVRRGLRDSFVDDRYVELVPVDQDGWYDRQMLERHADFPCDMLFVDGPVGAQEGLGSARRFGTPARDWLREQAARTSVLVVDDVHRASILEMFNDLLAQTDGLRPLYLSYPVGREADNVVAIAARSEVYDKLVELCAPLEIPIMLDYTAAQCSEP